MTMTVPPSPEEQQAIVDGLALDTISDSQLLGVDGLAGKPSFTEVEAHAKIAANSKALAGIREDLDVLAYSWPVADYDPNQVKLAMADAIVYRALKAEADKRAAARK